MSAFTDPVIAWRGSTDADAPLVVLLHGRGSNEVDIIGLTAIRRETAAQSKAVA